MSSLTMAAAIRGTLVAAMQDDDHVLLLGENVGRSGGIAGTSEGFLAAWLRHRGVNWAADLIPNLTNLESQP